MIPVKHIDSADVILWLADCIELLRSDVLGYAHVLGYAEPAIASNSVHSVVTDPPYGIDFMNNAWDRPSAMLGQISPGDGSRGPLAAGPGTNSRGYADHDGRAFQAWCETWAVEVLRVLKPGGMLVAFGGDRAYHRLTSGIEDAGFEIRRGLVWIYGQGFAKGLNVSKAIDKGHASARERALEFTAWLKSTGITAATINAATGTSMATHYLTSKSQPEIPTSDQFDLLRPFLPDEIPEEIDELVRVRSGEDFPDYQAREVDGMHPKESAGQVWAAPFRGAEPLPPKERRETASTPEAAAWEGWISDIKPGFEPIVVARKPLGFDVRAHVEAELRRRLGIEEIRWTRDPASDAARRSPTPSSGSTEQPRTAATSAGSASENATRSTANETGTPTAAPPPHGGLATSNTPAPEIADETAISASPSSPLTVESASAVERIVSPSSRSTTSPEAEPHTAERFTERSTPNSDAADSLPATASSVGIATGLTDSMARVLIKRMPDGSFEWPEGLPLATGSNVAANILEHGTGAYNVGATSVDTDDIRVQGAQMTDGDVYSGSQKREGGKVYDGGRVTPNVILSHVPLLDDEGEIVGDACADGCVPGCAVRELDEQAVGSSRFFPAFRYNAKAGPAERPVLYRQACRCDAGETRWAKGIHCPVCGTVAARIAHPTVKPVALIRWLIRLVTVQGGTVFDPFAGSGSGIEASLAEHDKIIAIELGREHVPLIEKRLHERTTAVAGAQLAERLDSGVSSPDHIVEAGRLF